MSRAGRTIWLTALLLASTVATAQAPAPAASSRAAAAAAPLLAQAQREVEQLQHAVDAQEQRSREADQRLDQQDAAIAELRRQIKALEAAGRDRTRDPA